jgi:hypothetical protein
MHFIVIIIFIIEGFLFFLCWTRQLTLITQREKSVVKTCENLTARFRGKEGILKLTTSGEGWRRISYVYRKCHGRRPEASCHHAYGISDFRM